MNLKNKTIAEAKELIKRKEGRNYYQVYVVTKKHYVKDYKKIFKKYHFYDENGKRAYKIIEYDLYTYAESEALEDNNIIIDIEIEKGEASHFGFNGFVGVSYHNVYNLIVKKLVKGNCGTHHKENFSKKIITFKDGELTAKQRRIVF